MDKRADSCRGAYLKRLFITSVLGNKHRYNIMDLKTLIALLLATNVFVASAQTIPKTMKAVVAREYGGPEKLKVEEVPVPQPKDTEVLVRVIASGVNPADPLILSGKFADKFGTKLPLTLGYDMAGIVVKAGKQVRRLKVGDPVYAYLLFGGGWAGYCISNETEAVVKPKSLNFTDASAVPLAGLTAWQALEGVGNVKTGDTVLIHGGSGGVGSFAIQIAKASGAKVFATASTANQDLLKQLGADVAIDYTKQKFEDVVHDATFVLDTVGGDTLKRSYGVVKKGGMIVTIVAKCDEEELKKHGITGKSLWSHPDAAELSAVGNLITEGKVKPVVSQVLPMSDAAKATTQAETHHTRGKIVLRIADEPSVNEPKKL
jgi:NADPH:quinone reductase-like Zn-dependent oxidoreductase